MTNRSPGTWEVWGDGAVRVIDPNVRDYGSPIVRTLVAGDPRNPHRMADARLIAAAPELLEACRMALEGQTIPPMDKAKFILAAIAKATGGVND